MLVDVLNVKNHEFSLGVGLTTTPTLQVKVIIDISFLVVIIFGSPTHLFQGIDWRADSQETATVESPNRT